MDFHKILEEVIAMILFLSSVNRDARRKERDHQWEGHLANILSTVSCQDKGDPEALKVRTRDWNLKQLYPNIRISSPVREVHAAQWKVASVLTPGSPLAPSSARVAQVPLQSGHPSTHCDGVTGRGSGSSTFRPPHSFLSHFQGRAHYKGCVNSRINSSIWSFPDQTSGKWVKASLFWNAEMLSERNTVTGI